MSNLGPDHFFGTIFEREDEPGGIVMFLADCSDPAITLQPCKPFLAMDGTGTYGVQFRDVFVPDELILAEPAGPFVKKIRAGFILLQAGMALGLIKDCINIMDEVDAAARPRQPLSAAAAGAVPRAVCRVREGGDGAGAPIPTTRTTATGAASSRCACALGDAASRPRMRRCSIAARAAT